MSTDVSRLFTIVLLGGVPIAGAVAWLVGLVLHGLGRRTEAALRFVLWSLGVVMGTTLAVGIGALQHAPDPGSAANAVVLLGLPLAIVIGLAMVGRRRAGGLLLAGAATPWTAIFGFYAAQVMLGADSAPLFTAAMFLGALVPLVAGTALAIRGDPVHEPDPAAPAGRPGSRRPGSFGKRLVAEATYGEVLGPAIVAVIATTSLSALAIPGQPWLQLVLALAAAVLGAEVELRWIPPRVRPALEGFHWIGREEIERFRAATGGAVPRSARGIRRWLALNPETDATRTWRIEFLTFLGEHAAAQAELDRLAATTPELRLRRASLAAELSWVRGGPADLGVLQDLAAEAGPAGSPERLHADGLVAWWASRTALAAMDPAWRDPLAALRVELGHAADGLHATAMRPRTLVVPVILAAGFVLLGQLGR